MKKLSCCLLFLLVALFVLYPRFAPREYSVAPQNDMRWTSTREINDLYVDENGALWAATSGGLLRLQNGAWRKWAMCASSLILA